MTKSADAQYKIVDPVDMAVRRQPPLTIHPGVFFRETILSEYGLSVSRLAELIGVARPNLSNVLTGKADVSRDLAYRLGALMGDQLADFLINYQVEWDKQAEADRRAAFRASIERLPLPG